ncbi:MAG: hypothetical protein DRQ48_05385 [Gammaproteobacteria bacterium]|nr:MAG: hypothetical protein DRQ48_05385 [Gammaproteobacteria bacterium]
MGLGNSVAAIFTAADLNNETVQGTVNAWPITNTEGYQLLEISGTAPAEAYYSQWALNSQGINDLYEFAKDIQRRGTAETIHGINGSLFRGITTDVAYNTESGGPFVEDEVIAWGTTLNYDNEITGPFVVGEAIGFGTSGAVGVIRELTDAGATGSMVVQIEPGTGTVIDGEQISQLDGGTATADVAGTPVGTANVGGAGILIALYDNGTDGNLYLQVTNGTAPAAGYVLTGATSGATAAVNGSPVARTIAPVFIGSSTGSSLIGAYGIGAVPGDLSSSDKVFDLGNNLVTPPNNVTFTVFGLESGEDRVLVGPEAGGVIEFAQLTLDGLHNSGTTLTIVEDIPLDTPTAGTLRVLDDDGTYKLLNVSSWTGKVFTLDAAITDTFSDTANVWISYIDKAAAAASESFTGVYLSDRALFIRVRDGGVSPIKTFETTGTLGESGGSTTAIRTDDS